MTKRRAAMMEAGSRRLLLNGLVFPDTQRSRRDRQATGFPQCLHMRKCNDGEKMMR